mgnify:CR=1 FL=1
MPKLLRDGFEAHLEAKEYQQAYELAKADDSYLGHLLAAGMGKLQSGHAAAVEAIDEADGEEGVELDLLADGGADVLHADALEAGLRDAARAAQIPVRFNRCGSMFCGYFTDRPVWSLADAMHSDRERFKKFFHGMLAEGVYFAPSQFEAGFLSVAHTEADIAATVSAAAKVMRTL